MKRKLISVSAIAAVAMTVITICVIGSVHAQTDSGIGSNPHIRAQSAPTTSPGTTTIVKMSQKDVNFIQKAAGGGQQEVENGKMAEKQGKSAEVKSIGARMVADHTRIGKELAALANRKGVNFNTSSVKAQNIGTADFDRMYLKLENYPDTEATPDHGRGRGEKNAVIKGTCFYAAARSAGRAAYVFRQQASPFACENRFAFATRGSIL